MKIRAELHLNGRLGRVILVPRPEEKLDHLALKLAAVAMFLKDDPAVDLSVDHPALQGLDLRPDVCVLNEAGEVSIWIECGETSINKLDKACRRFTQARVVVLRATMHQARQMRDMVTEQVRQADRVEIWAWPEGEFKAWMNCMGEKTEMFGDAHEKSFNLVVNDHAYAVDLLEA